LKKVPDADHLPCCQGTMEDICIPLYHVWVCFERTAICPQTTCNFLWLVGTASICDNSQ